MAPNLANSIQSEDISREEDSDYEKKLIESEGSGIFNWMIEGLRRYYEEGHLIKPKAIEEATKDYKDDEDPIGEYLADRCVIDPDGRIPSAEIYSDYLNFCLMKEKITRLVKRTSAPPLWIMGSLHTETPLSVDMKGSGW